MTKSPWENEIFASESLESIDRQFLPGTRQEIEFIIEELNLPPGSSILDIGCGAGRHSIELAKAGYSVSGVDISNRMLKEARKRAQESQVNISFIELDVLSMENYFKKNSASFNGAICICESGLGSLGWQKDLSVLRMIHQLLEDNSKLILTTFNGLRKYRGERVKAESFDFRNGTVLWQLPDDWHGGEKLTELMRVYIPSEMKMLCEFAGFTSAEVFRCEPGNFNRDQLEPDDIELMVVCKK